MEVTYKPGRGVKPEARLFRHFAKAIPFRFVGVLSNIHNTHYRHTSKLRLTFTFTDPDTYDRLMAIRNIIPPAETQAKPALTSESLTINFNRYLDAEWSSYLENGNLSEVSRSNLPPMHVGDTYQITISISGTDPAGIICRPTEIAAGGVLYFKND